MVLALVQPTHGGISRHLFPQKELDPDSVANSVNNARYHFPARVLVPFRAHFLQRDPVFYLSTFAVLIDPYVYVAHSPTRFVDPWGMYKKDCDDKKKCPNGRTPVAKGFYWDNRTAEKMAEAAKFTEADDIIKKGGPKELDRRFLTAIIGDASIIKAFEDFGKTECKPCFCWDPIAIVGHGATDQLILEHFNKDLSFAPASAKKERNRTFAELGQTLSPFVCKPCTLWIFSCDTGNADAAPAELAAASGCTVISFTGIWNNFASGHWRKDPANLKGQIVTTAPNAKESKREDVGAIGPKLEKLKE